ncbi:MAG: cytidylate kinase-like family protein [Bacteroidales bacterium]|nr:cytidylate kinase-like family protein [Bacteroidales bacterium]
MNIKEQFVITLSREVGSGGRTIGKKLADKLGVRYCDKELLNALREKFNLTSYEIEKLKGEKKSWLADLFSKLSPSPNPALLNDPASSYLDKLPSDVTTDDIFKEEKVILNQLASESSCVIAGRSGFFVLKDCPNKFDVFITASRDKRIARVMDRQQVNMATAEIIVDQVDKMRDNFVKRYTDTSRYDARNYDLTLNVDNLTEDQAVDIILTCIGAK